MKASNRNWQDSSVFDLAHWKNGLAFRNIDFSDKGLPVIKIAELKNGVTSSTAFTASEYAPSVFVQAGDMLFSWSGNPDTSIDVFRWSGENGWLNQHIFKVTPSERVSGQFLYFLLKWLKPQFAEIARNKQTTGLGHVTIQDLKRMTVAIPDVSEQADIVSVLRPIQEKIELNSYMNKTLEAMAQAIFHDWFVNFGPTRAKMEGRAPYLTSNLWNLFPDKLDDEGKPEGWELRPLTEFFSIIGGGTPKTSNLDFWGGNIPWFSVKDMPKKGGIFVATTEKTITDAGLDGCSTKLIPKGTTIISARGTVGSLAIAGRDMAFNQTCYALRGTSPVGDCTAYLVAKNMVSRLQSMAHGSVFSTITRQTFASISLPMPPPAILKAFEESISLIFNKILEAVEESLTLAQIRDMLIPKLMSGTIHLSGAQKRVETIS